MLHGKLPCSERCKRRPPTINLKWDMGSKELKIKDRRSSDGR